LELLFKVLSQFNTLTLVEAMRTIYSPNLILISSSNIKMVVDILEAEEVALTLVINKKYKKKNNISSLPLVFSSNSRSKILLILQAPPSQGCNNLSSLKTSDNLF